ncbi:stage II sporulation protein M [bacterium]|nr:stage II sporulation protein M [bacterium]
MIYKLFAFSVILFGAGILLAKWVVSKKIDFLINIPIALLKFATGFIERNPSFLRIFLFIFLFNSANAVIYFFSGLVPYLPIILNVWLGMNIGIVFMTPPELKKELFFKNQDIEETEINDDVGKGLIVLIAAFAFIVIELFAIFFAISLSHEINIIVIKGMTFTTERFNEFIKLFLQYTIVGLFIAAFIETYLIKDSIPPKISS